MKFSGHTLRDARLARGFTQAELARRASVRERQIIRWENDQNVPRIGAVKAVARALGVSVDSLLSEEEDDAEADTLAALMDALTAYVRAEVHRFAAAAEGGRAG